MNLAGDRRRICGGWVPAITATTIVLLAALSVSAIPFSVLTAPPMQAASAVPSGMSGNSDKPGASRLITIRKYRVLDGGVIPNVEHLFESGNQRPIRSEELERIPSRVRSFYQGRGYFNAQIAEQRVEEAGRSGVNVFVRVIPGPQYRLKGIQFTGDTRFSTTQLAKLLSLRPGDVFTTDTLRPSIEEIRRFYARKGFPNAAVIPEPRVNDEDSTIQLEIRVVPEQTPGTATEAESRRASLEQLFLSLGYQKVGERKNLPRGLYTPDPEYDPISNMARVQGTARFRVGVGADGLVKVVVLERDGLLSREMLRNAETNLRTWRFEPALKDGQPIPVQMCVDVSFRVY